MSESAEAGANTGPSELGRRVSGANPHKLHMLLLSAWKPEQWEDVVPQGGVRCSQSFTS